MKLRDIPQAAAIKIELDTVASVEINDDAILQVIPNASGPARDAIVAWWASTGRADTVAAVRAYVRSQKQKLREQLSQLDVELKDDIAVVVEAEAAVELGVEGLPREEPVIETPVSG